MRGTSSSSGKRSSSAAKRSRAGRSSRSSPSRCRQSKKKGESGSSRAAPRRRAVCRSGSSSPGTGAAGRRRERDHLAVEHEHSERERAHRLHDLGHAVGHVGEVPREDAHLVALAVHLQARAVELPLDGGLAEPLERGRESVAGCASIGWSGRSRVSRNSASPRCPRQRRGARPPPGRRPASAPAERRRPGRRRLRDRVGHHCLQRALAQLAGRAARARNCCSGAVARRERPRAPRRAGCEPGPVVAPIRAGQRRPRARRARAARRLGRPIAQRRPADADRRMRQRAREVRDRHGHLVRLQTREHARRARRSSSGGRASSNVGRDLDELIQEHALDCRRPNRACDRSIACVFYQ